MSFDELTGAESRSSKAVVANSLMFISGLSLVFIAIGASIGSGRVASGISQLHSGSWWRADYFFRAICHRRVQAHFFRPLHSAPSSAQASRRFRICVCWSRFRRRLDAMCWSDSGLNTRVGSICGSNQNRHIIAADLLCWARHSIFSVSDCDRAVLVAL